MDDHAQQRVEVARRQEQELTQELAKSRAEESVLKDLKSYLTVISNAYEVILRYQGESAGVKLNRTVC